MLPRVSTRVVCRVRCYQGLVLVWFVELDVTKGKYNTVKRLVATVGSLAAKIPKSSAKGTADK